MHLLIENACLSRVKRQSFDELSFLHVCTIESQWFEYLCNYENMFETGVVRAKE